MRRRDLTLLCLLTLWPIRAGLAQAVPSPEEHLGRPVGADFELADWEEVSSWFRLLGQGSARVQVESVGETTEGRDFLLATISSEANLARLEELRAHARVLADPRGHDHARRAQAVEQGRVLLFVSCAMHATETAAPQMAMELAWLLANSDQEPWRSAREQVVVLLAPSLNPDGLDHVVNWYRRTVGTPYEASGLLELYQYYAGHDNNRDWFMLTQAETRIVTELLYTRWFPQVYWDVHQQGSRSERMFVPPFRDPLNPNLDAGVIAGIDLLGTRALFDMTREGLSGISSGVSYDMWWNGGNRNVPVRHNIVGLLTEAASVRLATPVFRPRSELGPPQGLENYAPSNRFPRPWPGGWWRLRDIIDYELAFARSLLGSLSRERRLWLSGALEAAERAVHVGELGEGAAPDESRAPRAWILPAHGRDVGAVRRLVDVLLATGVELSVATEELRTDGRVWPAGSLLIRRDQPYGTHVKDLFEVQRYPDGDSPYDVAGWTLPLLLGVHRVACMELPQGEHRAVTDPDQAIVGFVGDPRLEGSPAGSMSLRDSRTWRQWVQQLQSSESDSRFALATDTERGGILEPALSAGDPQLQEPATLRLPRIGVYSPWRGSMDEGWLRWVLDYFAIPFTGVRNEMLRAGALGDFLDVLILPGVSGRELDRGRSPGSVPGRYSGGLDPEGAVAVEEFVRGGGRVIAIGSSSSWVIDLLRLPLVDTTRGEEAGDFSCPGSVLRALPEEHALTVDLPDSIAVFFSRSRAWRAMTAEEMREAEMEAEAEGEGAQAPFDVLARYAPTRLLLSGWIRGAEHVEGKAAWVRARYGKGSVHLFGFRPQYRGWSQASFHLLMRALLLER